jgi:multiple sugar transport system permease protein
MPTASRRDARSGSTVKYEHKLLTPLLAVFAVAVGFPLLYSFWLGFTDYKLVNSGATKFVGLQNYVSVLSDGAYWSSFATTAAYVLLSVSLELIIGLSIALALQKQKWVKDLTRSVLLAPMFITPIAVGLMFRFFLNDQLGAIPNFLKQLGLSYDFFGPGRALISLAFIDVWQWTPFMILLLLAGLESIPKQPLEAARVDGANSWYSFRRITLPMLSPVLVVAILLRGLDALKVFEYVFATTRGGPGTETKTIQFLAYQTGITYFRLSEASAMAFILLIVILAIIVILFRNLEKASTL